MIFLVVALIAISAALLVTAGVSVLASGGQRNVDRQLAAIRSGDAGARALEDQRRRIARRQQLAAMLEAIGDRMEADDATTARTRQMLQQAGIRNPKGVIYYFGSRILLAAGLGVGAFVLGVGAVLGLMQTVLWAAIGAMLGWMLPFIYVRLRVRRRQNELQRGLPDALDLMVVCVEAGLGMNQALMRVGEEMERISPPICDELMVVGLEIRAGTPRPEALRNLGKRTGVDDIRALVGMMIQTDRFGTSIARALRVQSDALRTKRRQRAEEAAAKTSIKMLFPLVFFIFPALFVAILGPAVFHLATLFTVQ